MCRAIHPEARMNFFDSCRALLQAAALVVLAGMAAGSADDSLRPVRIRVQWGGGTPRGWTGQITIVHPEGAPGPVQPWPVDWQTLCLEPDAAALAHGTPDGIAIHEPRPVASDGIELTIHDWPRARLRVQLGPTATIDPDLNVEVAVADLLDAPHQVPLDGDGNRLTIAPAPGDPLRVTLAKTDATDSAAANAVHRPGDVLRFRVDPLIPLKPGAGDVELRLRLSAARQNTAIDAQATKLVSLSPPGGTAAVGGRLPTPFAGVDFELSLPAEEGVYEVTLEAVELRGLRWTKPLASRVIQIVAIADQPPASTNADWEILYELDPGSPRLHERLRRLPARGLAAMPLPAVQLPAMPLPSLSRPTLPLPKLPEVPVPLPDMSAMVPRFGGLLASGHSVVAPHPLGPMLRLPPAVAAGQPAWEALVIAAAREGMPHAVEIDYPTNQRATLAACILEADAAGALVEVRHAGGVEVEGQSQTAAPQMATHRFVFWPTSRNPVLVIANAGTGGPALVGGVRVLVGPSRLPPTDAAEPAGAPRQTSSRPTYAMLAEPDLPRLYGGPGRPGPGGRAFADWLTHLTAIRHSAETVSSQGLAGAVIAVYADGAAAWPTTLTRGAARWNAAGDASLDPVPKDVLAAMTRVYAREGLSLIPSLRFDAAIPSLEAERAGETATGIVCVGGDGRPRQLPGGPHYNILDPRVQRAVETVIAELADRLRSNESVAGIAIELPHDGWLHLPGLAWGLDDATFARFLAAIDGSNLVPDEGRFAERARLVQGPLREEWLAWRTGQLAAFHARLTAIVAGTDGRWPLYVVPTTLFTSGDVAHRFRPQAAARQAAADDLLREVGLITTLPDGIAHGGRLCFMSPHVFAGGASLTEQAVVMAANASLPLAFAAATAPQRGVAIVSRPLTADLTDVVPHGPFGAAAAGGVARLRIISGRQQGDRELAASLVAADASIVFDMRPALTATTVPCLPRQAEELLPAGPLRLVDGLPAPLVVRSVDAGGRTWMQIVNAAARPSTATVKLAGSPSPALDAVTGTALAADAGHLRVPLAAWDVRAIVVDGACRVEGVTVDYGDDVVATTGGRIEQLRQRLGVLQAPQPLEVLDNPGFEFGLARSSAPGGQTAITGWELLEPRRGSLTLVAGIPPAADPDGPLKQGRGLEFSSFNGLSTLRSNPFASPETGRISVAAWLRVKPGDPQPPLRIAVEGVEDGREYYRFAPIGGLAGGRPLTASWSLFMLQVDDLPAGSVDSMRVRFDLLGPGGVQIDDVRVFDLAFDENERNSLAKEIARIDHQFKNGDVGGALVGLEGHWPAFLAAFVSDEAVAAMVRRRAGPVAEAADQPPAEERQGALDRFRGWWQ